MNVITINKKELLAAFEKKAAHDAIYRKKNKSIISDLVEFSLNKDGTFMHFSSAYGSHITIKVSSKTNYSLNSVFVNTYESELLPRVKNDIRKTIFLKQSENQIGAKSYYDTHIGSSSMNKIATLDAKEFTENAKFAMTKMQKGNHDNFFFVRLELKNTEEKYTLWSTDKSQERFVIGNYLPEAYEFPSQVLHISKFDFYAIFRLMAKNGTYSLHQDEWSLYIADEYGTTIQIPNRSTLVGMLSGYVFERYFKDGYAIPPIKNSDLRKTLEKEYAFVSFNHKPYTSKRSESHVINVITDMYSLGEDHRFLFILDEEKTKKILKIVKHQEFWLYPDRFYSDFTVKLANNRLVNIKG